MTVIPTNWKACQKRRTNTDKKMQAMFRIKMFKVINFNLHYQGKEHLQVQLIIQSINDFCEASKIKGFKNDKELS